MSTGNIAITEGSGKYVATNAISEDAVTKQLSRNVLNDSSGNELGVTGNRVYIIGTTSVVGGVSVLGGTVGATQSGAWTTSVVGGVSILGGNVGVTQFGSWTTSVVGGVSVLGGNVGVTQLGAWTTSVVGAVSILGGSVNVVSVLGATTLYAQPGSYVWGVSSINTGTTAASVLAAPGSNLRNYITTIKVTNAAANAVIVDIKDSGANVLDSGYCAASGGGWSTTFTVPIRQTTTNASIDVVPRSQGSIIAAIVGYVAA